MNNKIAFLWHSGEQEHVVFVGIENIGRDGDHLSYFPSI